MKKSENVVMIGMPGAGKTTLGVLLAKALSRPFLDTDILIQTREGRSLREIIRTDGMDRFRSLEERHAISLDCRGHVIATGGSVVYSPRAMEHLRSNGVTLYLEISLPLLTRRVGDMDERGIVRAPDQSLALLYKERAPLYERYADLRVLCDGKVHEEIVREMVQQLDRITPCCASD